MSDDQKPDGAPEEPQQLSIFGAPSANDGTEGTDDAPAPETTPTATRAESTLRAYEADVRSYVEWCEANGLESTPATRINVVSYLCVQVASGIRRATAKRRVVAIAFAERARGNAVTWGTPSAILDEIRARIPTAFAAEENARTVAEERDDMLRVLAWLQRQAPPAANVIGYAIRLTRDGEHVGWRAPNINDRFSDSEQGIDSTTCDVCGETLAYGWCATDAECLEHRCLVEES